MALVIDNPFRASPLRAVPVPGLARLCVSPCCQLTRFSRFRQPVRGFEFQNGWIEFNCSENIVLCCDFRWTRSHSARTLKFALERSPRSCQLWFDVEKWLNLKLIAFFRLQWKEDSTKPRRKRLEFIKNIEILCRRFMTQKCVKIVNQEKSSC